MAPTKRRRWPYALALSGLALPASASAGNGPRLAPPGCITHEVVPGDNAWTIARDAGTTLDVIATLNPQIPNLNLIRPGDTIATACPGLANIKADPTLPAPIVVNEMRRVDYLGEQERPGVASKRAVLAALYQAGARGEQLITLAALTEGESGRQLAAIGDLEIQSGDWGPSRGVFQIRTLKSQTGTGKTRDILRVGTLEGGARSAVELWNQSIERGTPGGNPWTAYLLGWHQSYMAGYREVAKEMGL